MDRSLNLTIKDEEFIFDFRRAIYWPSRKILIGTDLHWGKTQFLRQNGIAISDDVFMADLKRLSSLFADYDVSTFLVLGDLLHHERALTKNLIEKVAWFRHEYPCELILVKGNHDRFANFPESWGIVEEASFYLKDFAFHHEMIKKEVKFQFSGHVHPMIRLRAGHDFMRLPSFIVSPKHCLLPAFSYLTGGQDVKLGAGEEAIVVTDESVERFKN